jgi:hypothetical protein
MMASMYGKPVLPSFHAANFSGLLIKNIMFFAKSTQKVLKVKSAYFSHKFLLTLDPDPFFRELKPKFRSKFLMSKQF